MPNPNPFTPQEKDLMRTYMMVPKVFSTPGALLEGIFDAIDGLYNTDDAGATQAAIRTTLTNLQALEAQIATLQLLLLATDVENEVKLNASNALAVIRYQEGPALINQLASRLAFVPDRNYFEPTPVLGVGQLTTSYRRYLVPKY